MVRWYPAVFAASARAPITAVLIIFELTGDYRIVLPLMVAVVIATALSNSFTRDTIYTLKLRRRGIDIDDATQTPTLMGQIKVAEAMGKLPRPLAHAPPATPRLPHTYRHTLTRRALVGWVTWASVVTPNRGSREVDGE
jgi:hypothetical protein